MTRAEYKFEEIQDNFLNESRALNADIHKWNLQFVWHLKDMVLKLNKDQKSDLVRLLKYKYGFQNDLLFRIQYTFPRSAILWSKGAGKGYIVRAGNIQRLDTNKSKPGIHRYKSDWFNPVLKDHIELLSEEVAKHYASLMANTYARLSIK